jgi:hypothetical protein
MDGGAPVSAPPVAASRDRRWTGRLPELCGGIWLGVLAGGVWLHTHATQQAPIYDAFTYYWKAHSFWVGVRAGSWFNPLNVEPTFRPPGTVLMSYPFGFDPDPRGFYFRSVYLPALLLFASVLVVAYERRETLAGRWRAILTGIMLTTLTQLYHFEFGARAAGYWGLVDSFLAGLAALTAACVWRGTRRGAGLWVWAVAASATSAAAVMVKPSGLFVAAIAGLLWVSLALGTLIEGGASWRRESGLLLRLLGGAAVIGLTQTVTLAAALSSRYLSPENLAYGYGAIAIMKAELHLSLSLVRTVVNTSLGGAAIVCAGLVATVCVTGSITAKGRVLTLSDVIAVLASLAALIFGMWFWLLGSGGATEMRYAVPFFVMGAVWFLPAVTRTWHLAPSLLRRVTSGIVVVAACNLALILLVPQPSLAWQKLTGVSVTAAFPPEVMAAFKRLLAVSSGRSRDFYVLSFDVNDANLESIVDQSRLLHPDDPPVSLHRPVDWARPSTFRIDEIAAADALLLTPQQAQQAPTGSAVANMSEEQGVFTAWADRLGPADGIAVSFSAATAKILTVVDPVKFRASLARLVALHEWNPTFRAANHLPAPLAEGQPPRR